MEVHYDIMEVLEECFQEMYF